MRASSGMIGTIRWPISGSRIRSLSRRGRTPSSSRSAACRSRDGPTRRPRPAASAAVGVRRRAGTQPPSARRRSSMYWMCSCSMPGGSTAAGLASRSVVGDRDLQPVAEALEVVQGELLHLVRRVAALEVAAERPALDGLGEDDRRLARVLGRGAVGRVHLAVVVAAALQLPDLVVGHALDHLAGARVARRRSARGRRRRPRLVRLVVAVAVLFIRLTRAPSLSCASELVPVAAPDRP